MTLFLENPRISGTSSVFEEKEDDIIDDLDLEINEYSPPIYYGDSSPTC